MVEGNLCLDLGALKNACVHFQCHGIIIEIFVF